MNRIIRSLAIPAIGLALASAGCESMPWNTSDNSDDMKKAVTAAKHKYSFRRFKLRKAWVDQRFVIAIFICRTELQVAV